jgi:hypothetical protein
MLQHFFIEGRYIGSTERSLEFVHAEAVLPTSYWFLCPCCGDEWAKVAVESKQHRGRWAPVIQSCRKCGGSGSIWRPWDYEYTENLPLAVLKWEFLRELERQGLNHGE